MMKLAAVVPVLVVCAATVARGQEPGVAYLIQGEHPGDNLGSSLATLDDLDGDGVREFAAGARDPSRGPDRERINHGYVVIASGKDGTVLRTLNGTRPTEAFGSALATIGDIDGDGIGELVVGNERGEFFMYSPVTGELLRKVDAHADLPGKYRQSDLRLSVPGDVDGDGTVDIVYGDCRFLLPEDEISRGRVSMYSGATGLALWHHLAGRPPSWTGCGVAGVADVDGDGLPDVAAGEVVQSGEYGRILIFRGTTGEIVQVIGEEWKIPLLGSNLEGLGDLDGDGLGDIAAAADFRPDSPRQGRGRVLVLSGSDFHIIHDIEGLDGDAGNLNGDLLGLSMSTAGDVDGDGTPDFLLGTFRLGAASSGRRLWGRAFLHSGRSGDLLAAYEGPNSFTWFVTDLAPLGDVDGDGKAEFLLASAFQPSTTTIGGGAGEGQVRAMTFDPGMPTFIRGDANRDGRVNIADAIALLGIIFIGADAPDCPLALDINNSRDVDTIDALDLLGYIFRGRDAPAPPFPGCGRYGGPRRARLACERSTCEP